MEKQTGPIKVISSTAELRTIFSEWVKRIYTAAGQSAASLPSALKRLNRLVSYKWNVVEVLPGVFFETYILADWGHAFHQGPVYPAWAGFCDGMRDHFAILWTGQVTLCCIDYDGRTVIGRLPQQNLSEILAGEPLGGIMKGFKRFQPVHPYCRRCLGSKDRLTWLFKPGATIIGLHLLRPYFYQQVRLFE